MTNSEISEIKMHHLSARSVVSFLWPEATTTCQENSWASSVTSHYWCAYILLQKSVISWLLNHDPAKRPTATELLKSELLPPPQMEESELHEVLHHTLANVDGKAYRTMMAHIFSQRIPPAIDYTYDSDILKVGLSQALNESLTWFTEG